MAKMTILEGNSNDKDNVRAFMVKGEKGDPGVSPTFKTRRTARGGIIEITDVEGTEELELYDGESYEIPTNGVIGWASEDTIPGGYEEINCGKVPTFFSSIAEMKAGTLSVGDIVQTLGFYEANDGGGAKYQIVATSIFNTDGSFAILLDNGLIAELVIENNTVNFLQLGAKRQDSNGLYDNKTYLENYLNNKNNYTSRLELFIDGGVYGFTPTELKGNNIYIKGNTDFHIYANNQTIIVPMANQSFIWSLGDGSTTTEGFKIDEIYFSSFNYSISNKQANISSTFKTITTALKINKTRFGNFGKIYFIGIDGTAFAMNDSFEIYFEMLNFRRINNLSSSVMIFDDSVTDEHISACIFDKLIFESIHGNLIEVKNTSVYNSTIRDINFEDYPYELTGYDIQTLTSEIIANMTDLNTVHHSILKLSNNSSWQANIINNINLNNFAFRTTIYNNIYYVFDVIVEIDNSKCTPIINNIVNQGTKKDIYVAYQTVTNNNYSNSFTLNNVVNNSSIDFILYFIGFNRFIGNPRLSKYTNTNNLPNQITPFYINNSVSTSSKPGNIHYDANAINPMKLVLKGETTGDRNIARIIKLSDTLNVRARPSDPTASSRVVVNNNKTTTYPASADFEWKTVDLTGINNGTVMTVSNGTSGTNPIIIDSYYFS